MSNWTFKRDYTTINGDDIRFKYPNTCRFFDSSRLNGGSGTEDEPFGVYANPKLTGSYYFLLASGNYSKVNVNSKADDGGAYSISYTIVGTSRDTTKFNFNSTSSTGYVGYGVTAIITVKDLTLTGGNIVRLSPSGTNKLTINYYNCIIEKDFISSGFSTPTKLYTKCIFSEIDVDSINGTNLMFSNCNLSGIAPSNLSLINNCDITVDQTGLSTAKAAYYMAYYNCKYKFSGTTAETEYTRLIPKDTDSNEILNPTADDYKAEFIRRATDVGLTMPEVNNMPLGRWVFSNDGKISKDIIYQDSEIYNWEIANNIRLGVSNDRPLQLPIVLEANVPSSFSPFNPKSENVMFNKGNVSFSEDIHISDRHEFFVTSNIIPLFGKKEITNIVTPNYLDYVTGVLMDSMGNIDFDNPITSGLNTIEAGKRYLVRSEDKEYASVLYNGSTYDTSLAQNRKNIIVGVANDTSFVKTSGNAVLYPIKNPLQFQSIQVRIVNKIPTEQITEGSLQSGYWYLVEHDTDQSNTTDYVTYKDVRYYAGSSFLADTKLTFSKSGNIHLRRCWAENYNNPNEEAIDKTFWQYEQKPKWCDIELGVTKCMLKNNNPNASEMEHDSNADDFNYIASGHEMYNQLENGTGGTPQYIPVFLRGAYMQIRLVFSTLNIM